MNTQCWAATAAAVLITVAAADGAASDLSASFQSGNPEIRSMSALEFGPEGLLFIGDSRSGTIFVVDTEERTPGEVVEDFAVPDLEGKIAAILGTTDDKIMIHDMAVNPLSHSVYLSVSRGRAAWDSKWELPNDLADANILIRVTTTGDIEEFSLSGVRYASAQLPNPVDMNETHRWKEGVSKRVDAITNIVYHEGRLYVAGLSNEEFSSAMWQMDFPFSGDASWSTLEIFHGAHGKYETHAPIRAFLPYEIDGQSYILASYLCTPLVSFPLADLRDGQHVKGKTLAEMGSGNYPLDMVLARQGDKEFIVMANSQLPLLTIDTAEVETYNGKPGITRESPTYTEGVSYVARAASGVQQLDNYDDDFLVALQRMPSGKLDLITLSLARLAM